MLADKCQRQMHPKKCPLTKRLFATYLLKSKGLNMPIIYGRKHHVFLCASSSLLVEMVFVIHAIEKPKRTERAYHSPVSGTKRARFKRAES